MLGLSNSAGYSNDMESDLFHPFATPQRCFEQTFGSGQSSDPYGYDVATNSLRRFAADQAGPSTWSSEPSFTPVSQAGYDRQVHLSYCISLCLYMVQSTVQSAEQHRQAQSHFTTHAWQDSTVTSSQVITSFTAAG